MSADESPRMTLLGTATSMGVPMIGCQCPVCTSNNPKDKRMRTSVAVQNGDSTFLIDTGPELRLQLIRESIEMIEAVVYTHGHADHILGLDDLRIFGFRKKQPVPVYCEDAVEETIRRTFSYAFDETVKKSLHSRPMLTFREIGLRPFELCGLTLQPIRLIHGRLPVLGYRINDVAFCTDVSQIPEESWPLLEGLRVLVLGAIHFEPHPTHFNIEGALEVVERLQPQQTFLTHVSHRLGYEETNLQLPDGVELSYDQQVIML